MANRIQLIAASLLAVACTVSSERISIEPSGPQPTQAYSTDGRVLAVERGAPDQPASYVRIVIAVDGQSPVRVELAPGWYLDKKGLRFSEHDRVQVIGRRETRAGSSILVARRIQKGDQVLELRDDADRPTWEQ